MKPGSDLKQRLIEFRRHIHAWPELKYQEEKTSQYVQKHLRALKIPFEAGIAGTGVLGLIDSGKPGPCILLRADMDALPIVEETALEFQSKNHGVMHACGHDAHTAILMGLAQDLLENRSSLLPKGRVLLCFQPAEEGGNGALKMIESGFLKRYQVQAAYGLHVSNRHDCGQVGVVEGPIMASVDQFKIIVKGKSGHGAIPQHTIDPIVVAAHLICALQNVVSRQVDPLDSCVLTVAQIKGGSAFNVIPEKVELLGTVRTFNPLLHDQFPEKIEKITQGIGAAFGAEIFLEYEKINKATINHSREAQIVRQAVQNVLGKTGLIEQNVRSMGGEDFSEFLARVPGCFYFLGTRNVTKGINESIHNSKFNIDEDALFHGLQVMREIVRLNLATDLG